MTFSHETAPFGIQAVSIYPTQNCNIAVSGPGRFYTPARKKTEVAFLMGYKYIYSIGQAVSKDLPLGWTPCNEELDWQEDECRLKLINDILAQKFRCTTPWLLRFAR